MEEKDIREMTANSIGSDLLQALLMEIKLLPKPWEALTKAKQDDIIDRLRSRVEHNVKMAIHILAADGRTIVVGKLDQITIKDGIKCVVTVGSKQDNLHEMYDATGKAVLMIVSDVKDHMVGTDEIEGEVDQRGLNMGHEYKPNSDGEGMGGDGGVIDGEVLGLPAPGETAPTQEELEQAFADGYAAAEQNKLQSDCPVMNGALCIEWVKGWNAFHKDQKPKGKKAA